MSIVPKITLLLILSVFLLISFQSNISHAQSPKSSKPKDCDCTDLGSGDCVLYCLSLQKDPVKIQKKYGVKPSTAKAITNIKSFKNIKTFADFKKALPKAAYEDFMKVVVIHNEVTQHNVFRPNITVSGNTFNIIASPEFPPSADNSHVEGEPTFNVYVPMPTITLANATKFPCKGGPIDGCWKEHISGAKGDVIAVHIYFENTSDTVAQETTLSIQVSRTSNFNELVFTGSVASTTVKKAVGRSHLYITDKIPLSIAYMTGDGQARWSLRANKPLSVDENSLFGEYGFNIGTVPPHGQGYLVAHFLISD
jgi:hypothetical protein